MSKKVLNSEKFVNLSRICINIFVYIGYCFVWYHVIIFSYFKESPEPLLIMQNV